MLASRFGAVDNLRQRALNYLLRAQRPSATADMLPTQWTRSQQRRRQQLLMLLPLLSLLSTRDFRDRFAAAVSTDERGALMDLYSSWGEPPVFFGSWSDANPCGWLGVGCAPGHDSVTYVALVYVKFVTSALHLAAVVRCAGSSAVPIPCVSTFHFEVVACCLAWRQLARRVGSRPIRNNSKQYKPAICHQGAGACQKRLQRQLAYDSGFIECTNQATR